MVEDLTYEEKIETILSILATPIWRRRLGDNELNKLITEAYFEMKERKCLNTCSNTSGGTIHTIPAGPKAQEVYRQRYDDSVI